MKRILFIILLSMCYSLAFSSVKSKLLKSGGIDSAIIIAWDRDYTYSELNGIDYGKTDSLKKSIDTSLYYQIVRNIRKITVSEKDKLFGNCMCGLEQAGEISIYSKNVKMYLHLTCPDEPIYGNVNIGGKEYDVVLKMKCDSTIVQMIKELRYKIFNTGKIWGCTELKSVKKGCCDISPLQDSTISTVYSTLKQLLLSKPDTCFGTTKYCLFNLPEKDNIPDSCINVYKFQISLPPLISLLGNNSPDSLMLLFSETHISVTQLRCLSRFMCDDDYIQLFGNIESKLRQKYDENDSLYNSLHLERQVRAIR
jgi:hypothetical protein